MRRLFVIFTLALGACTSAPKETQYTQAPGLCGEKFSQSTGMQLSMAQQAFANQNYYSALAMLQKIEGSYITKTALEAKALLKTNQWDEANKKYTSLLNSCMKGQAAHGLGLLTAYQKKYKESGHWLRFAVDMEPANSDIRNDYGFYMLLIDEVDVAKKEFLTALELNPNNQKAAKNLWLALARGQDLKAAESLTRRYGWDQVESQKLANALNTFNPIKNLETSK
ncbi:hypothetical protein NB466_18075 [Vibrio fluvialis]|uniref:tetratricopeptide repeat protein n=1 Tax=Vibrio fluvialis TaxID=676 RepID=UPI00215B8DF9|nr:hypothetical protein [Vibrio fluvialis]MCR9300762.1 hypothetical protein [Vibrio fluvialis]